MKKTSGFSLIEILIVLGILAGLVAFTSTRPKNQQKDYKRFFRQFSIMAKEIKNRAQIEKATYRIVFILEEEKPPRISVEKTNKPILLGSEKQAKEKLKELFEERTQPKGKKKKKKDPEGFKVSKKFKFERLSMPKNLEIKQIEISGLSEPSEIGDTAIMHFFPQGLVEEVAIQILAKGSDLEWTLISDPITGEFYSFGSLKTLKEIQER